jgi:hypothetical protein
MDQILAKVRLWVLYYSGALFALFLWTAIAMVVEAFGGARELAAGKALLEEIPPASKMERTHGRALEDIEKLREKCASLPPRSAAWWTPVDEAIERYESPDQRVGYFLVSPAPELISPDDVVDQYYAGSRWQVIPSLLTSLGLLGTFVALLWGLKDLTVDPRTNVVQHVSELIAQLSGKFVTSVVALLLSVIFMCLDTFVCQRPLARAARAVLRSVEGVLPHLSPSRILLDMQRQTVKQTVHLSNISADVVDKFASVFKTDLGPLLTSGMSASVAHELKAELVPVLQGVSEVMRDLAATVARLETGKQESVVGELRGLISALEASIRDSLTEMGRQFQASLTASTQDEFGALAEVVKGSAGVLGQMTASFASMEGTLRAIVEEAHNSTSSQRQASVEQTERLNQLVEGLMLRLNSAASQNFDQVGAMLTRVVSELSAKVTDLSEELVQTVRASTSETQVVAQTTLEQAGSWSAKTGEQLETLLKTLQAKAVDFDKAGDTLLQAQEILHATLQQNNEALRALGVAAGGVKTYTEGLAGLQAKLEEQGRVQMQVTSLSRESVAKLSEAAQRHGEFLEQYRTVFNQYKSVFDGLDSQLGRTLTTILEKLAAYNRAVENNFKEIVTSANSVIPGMAASLKNATVELEEQLVELTDTLEKFNKKKPPE